MENDTDKRNPFTKWHLGAIAISSVLGLLWLINSPASKISEGAFNIFDFSVGGLDGNDFVILLALGLFIVLLVQRLTLYSKITRDKMIAIAFFSFFIIFFWAVFEQAPGTLTIFASDYTNRVLTGNASLIYLIVNSLITVVPLILINWVLLQLFKRTFKNYTLANTILGTSFVIIWVITLWMLTNDWYQAGHLTLSDGFREFLMIEPSTVPLTEVPGLLVWNSELLIYNHIRTAVFKMVGKQIQPFRQC